MSPSATQSRMQELNKSLDTVEEVCLTEKTPKSILKKLPKLAAFISHCCQSRHYSFCIKKCGEPTCEICRPVRLPSEVFTSVHFLPDPVPGEDEHYKPFDEVYGTETSESHRPSLIQKSKKRKSLPFTASIQHVRNVNLIVQCEQCGMWRLIYSPNKLKAEDKRLLERKIDNFAFSCGTTLEELDLPEHMQNLAVRQLQCEEPVEKLYYSMGYEPICIYCSSEDNLDIPNDSYPICEFCKGLGKPVVTKRV